MKNKTKKAYEYVSEIFGKTLDDFNILVAKNREGYNKFVNKKTPPWMVGSKIDNKTIVVLDPKVWEKDSPMHNPDEFDSLLKHEIAHLFIDQEANYKPVPRWIHEGLAQYVANQVDKKDLFEKSIPKNFCKRMTGNGWNEMIEEGGYLLSGLFINFLIDRFSLKKVFDLLHNLDPNYDWDNFKKTFLNIFKIKLENLEDDFVFYNHKKQKEVLENTGGLKKT